MDNKKSEIINKMNDMGKISVIIPAYNVCDYLEKSVESIVNQTYNNIELILVDDGSTDGTAELVDELAKKYSKVVAVHQNNKGLPGARNTGIRNSSGEYISFVDADDYIDINTYEVLISEMENPSISIVAGGMIVVGVDGKEQRRGTKKRLVLTREEALKSFFLKDDIVMPSASNKLFRKEIFENARFRENVRHDDTEAMPRFLDRIDKMVVIDFPFYHYIKRENSITTAPRFSVPGYRFLQSMPAYKKMCKKKYPSLKKVFAYYELESNYGMLLDLIRCIDRNKHPLIQILLRFRILRLSINNLFIKQNRDQYYGRITEYIKDAVVKYSI